MDCCDDKKSEKRSGLWQGIIYGTIPHIGCIMFIVGSVLGVTVLMKYFRPFLMNRYFFHYLIVISLGFATLSSFLYLRKNKSLSLEGIKRKKGYLYIMYGSTVGINLVLFLLVFPYLANVTGGVIGSTDDLSMLKISVDIPCPGHAPLISSEVKTIEGVKGSQYSFPNDFEVYYDSSETTKKEILGLEVFEEYPATVLDESVIGYSEIKQTSTSTQSSGGCGCGSCGGGGGSCGGSCGG
jgi:uncharacterized membrane protein YgcG